MWGYARGGGGGCGATPAPTPSRTPPALLRTPSDHAQSPVEPPHLSSGLSLHRLPHRVSMALPVGMEGGCCPLAQIPFPRKGLRGFGGKVSVMPIRGCGLVVGVSTIAYGDSRHRLTGGSHEHIHRPAPLMGSHGSHGARLPREPDATSG